MTHQRTIDGQTVTLYPGPNGSLISDPSQIPTIEARLNGDHHHAWYTEARRVSANKASVKSRRARPNNDMCRLCGRRGHRARECQG